MYSGIIHIITSKTLRDFPDCSTCSIAVLGLGYVGLPLAIEFAKNSDPTATSACSSHNIIAFDINSSRIHQLIAGKDLTGEISDPELLALSNIHYTYDPSDLSAADVFIVTVPTPIDSSKRPDTKALESASLLVGEALLFRSRTTSTTFPIVIFESTVYPGATEEFCVPLIESSSSLLLNQDFFVGYSPERINPGKDSLKLNDIVKVTSGSSEDSARWIDSLYSSIITAGTHLCDSIRIAEAAKVIENTQRDINIALMNELSIIFDKMNIDIFSVLEAANTKWNFLNFTPGLVGGHCIGVDPYYLTYKSEILGYKPEMVLAGRRINDSMSAWIVERLIKALASRQLSIGGSQILLLGLTFKENCPDTRNSKVFDIQRILLEYNSNVHVYDPLISPELLPMHDSILSKMPYTPLYDAIVLCVSHDFFRELPLQHYLSCLKPNGLLFDVKNILPKHESVISL